MFQSTKIHFIALFLVFISIEINAVEPIVEENPADMYLGTCYAMQYLKLHYFPSTNTTKMATCISSIVDEIDVKKR
jgi:hypothetical protein